MISEGRWRSNPFVVVEVSPSRKRLDLVPIPHHVGCFPEGVPPANIAPDEHGELVYSEDPVTIADPDYQFIRVLRRQLPTIPREAQGLAAPFGFLHLGAMCAKGRDQCHRQEYEVRLDPHPGLASLRVRFEMPGLLRPHQSQGRSSISTITVFSTTSRAFFPEPRVTMRFRSRIRHPSVA